MLHCDKNICPGITRQGSVLLLPPSPPAAGSLSCFRCLPLLRLRTGYRLPLLLSLPPSPPATGSLSSFRCLPLLSSGYRLPLPRLPLVLLLTPSPPAAGSLSCFRCLPLLRLPATGSLSSFLCFPLLSSGYRLPAPSAPFVTSLSSPPATGSVFSSR